MIKDKVIVITGASSGIGNSTAKVLASKGAKLAVGARRTDRLEKLQEEITKQGGEIIISKLDVTQKADCDSLVNQAIEKWGKVDVLINNAGLMPLSFVKNLKVEEWERMVDVNFKGVLFCTAAVLPNMLDNGTGHIINLIWISYIASNG